TALVSGRGGPASPVMAGRHVSGGSRQGVVRLLISGRCPNLGAVRRRIPPELILHRRVAVGVRIRNPIGDGGAVDWNIVIGKRRPLIEVKALVVDGNARRMVGQRGQRERGPRAPIDAVGRADVYRLVSG